MKNMLVKKSRILIGVATLFIFTFIFVAYKAVKNRYIDGCAESNEITRDYRWMGYFVTDKSVCYHEICSLLDSPFSTPERMLCELDQKIFGYRKVEDVDLGTFVVTPYPYIVDKNGTYFEGMRYYMTTLDVGYMLDFCDKFNSGELVKKPYALHSNSDSLENVQRLCAELSDSFEIGQHMEKGEFNY